MPTFVLMPDLLQIATAPQENVFHHEFSAFNFQFSAQKTP